jgi:hypothetical protein
VVKSVPERRPRIEAVAVGRLKVMVPAFAVMPQSLEMAVVLVEKVMTEPVVVAQPEPSAVKPPRPAAVRQVEEMAKQPLCTFKPFEKVEVAIELRLMKLAPTPIERSVPGVLVPMPWYPFERIEYAV